jgi:hypothetical protein
MRHWLSKLGSIRATLSLVWAICAASTWVAIVHDLILTNGPKWFQPRAQRAFLAVARWFYGSSWVVVDSITEWNHTYQLISVHTDRTRLTSTTTPIYNRSIQYWCRHAPSIRYHMWLPSASTTSNVTIDDLIRHTTLPATRYLVNATTIPDQYSEWAASTLQSCIRCSNFPVVVAAHWAKTLRPDLCSITMNILQNGTNQSITVTV